MIAIVLIGALLLGQARSNVDLADEADLHFSIGAERFKQHDYRGALEHFLLSNRLVPNRNVVFDIANTYAQLKQYPDAYRYYHQALEGESDPRERKRIEKAIERVAPGVAVLRVETDPPGATLYVDRKDLGARGSSPAVLAFAPGKYKVFAELEGHESAASEAIDAKLGSDTKVALKLKKLVGTVRVTGSPPGAEIRADGGETCTLPCELQLPLGKATLSAQLAGFQKGRREIYVLESGTEPAEFELVEQKGKLSVNADERGAAVQIDGKLAGFTPAVIEAPVGIRTVRITLPGFEPWEHQIQITHGEQPALEAQLSAIEEVSAASRTNESVDDAPSSVSIITGKELRAMGYPTIAEALRGVRGVFVGDDTSYASLGFRGYGPVGSYGNKVLILVDGHSTNDNWIDSSYVGYDNRTDLDDIERIEIVRGPGSVLYGTGAFVGVVNLVTRQNDKPSEGSVTLGTTEDGAVRAHGTARKVFENGGFDLSAAGLSSSGRDFYFPELFADSRGADGFRSGTVAGKVWVGALTLQAQSVARDKAMPAGEYGTALSDPGSHLIDRRAFGEARFEPHLGQWGELFLRGYWDRYTYDASLVSPPGVPDGLRHERYTGEWWGGEARVTLHPWSFIRLMLGGEYQKHYTVAQFGQSALDTPAPKTYLDAKDPFDVSAGYVLLDLKPWRSLHLSAGARLDHYSTFGNSVNPRVSLIFKPTESDIFKLMGGRAFRAPSIYELYYNDGGQSQLPACPDPTVTCTALSPERILSAELEYTRHLGGFWTALGSVWASAIDGVLELGPAPGRTDDVSQYRNGAAPVRAYGLELELRREWRQGFMASATYSYARVKFHQGSDVADADRLREVPNSPQHLASLKLAVPIVQRALTAMTRVSIEGPRYDRNSGPRDPPQGQTGSSASWDLVLSGELPDFHARFCVGVYNLAGFQYNVPISPEFAPLVTLQQPGRRVLGSLTLSL